MYKLFSCTDVSMAARSLCTTSTPKSIEETCVI